MSGYTQKLGDLQKKILKHMISCNEDVETVSHISREVGALQPDVFRSTKKMIDDGILDKKTTSKSNRMELVLTDKGIAIAVLVGIKNERLENYFSKSIDYKSDYDRERHKLFDIIMQQTKDTTKQQILLKRGLGYMIEHGWYDQEKENKILDPQEKLYLVLDMVQLMQTDSMDLKSVIDLSKGFGVSDILGGILMMEFHKILYILVRCSDYQDMPMIIAQGEGDFKGLLNMLIKLLDDIRKSVDIKPKLMTNKGYLSSMMSIYSMTEEEVKKKLNEEIKYAQKVFEFMRENILTKIDVTEDTKSLPKKKKPT